MALCVRIYIMCIIIKNHSTLKMYNYIVVDCSKKRASLLYSNIQPFVCLLYLHVHNRYILASYVPKAPELKL